MRAQNHMIEKRGYAPNLVAEFQVGIPAMDALVIVVIGQERLACEPRIVNSAGEKVGKRPPRQRERRTAHLLGAMDAVRLVGRGAHTRAAAVLCTQPVAESVDCGRAAR